MVCVLAPAGAVAGVSRADAIDGIRAAVADLPGGTVAGEPAMLRYGFAMLERDGNLLGTAPKRRVTSPRRAMPSGPSRSGAS